MLNLLSDYFTYKLLSMDPTNMYKTELEILLSEAQVEGINNNKEYQYLNITYPRIPVIYYLPKIHKDQANPPARPAP